VTIAKSDAITSQRFVYFASLALRASLRLLLRCASQ